MITVGSTLWSMALGVMVVLGGPFGPAKNSPAPRGVSGRSGVFCRSYCPPRLTRGSAEGPADGGLLLVKGHTPFEGFPHASPRVIQREKYKE